MPGKIKDRTGQRYGRLVALALDHTRIDNRGLTQAYWRCRCDCGAEMVTFGKNLQSGNTKSCGCYNRDRVKEIRTKHGESAGYTYNSWRAARERCYNPGARRYDIYGGRGITMCERWADYRNFLADMGRRPPGKTLDRIDPDGNYEPDNCRWATPEEQAANLKHAFRIPHEGGFVSLSHFARIHGVVPATLYYRVTRHGQTPEQAVAELSAGLKPPSGQPRRRCSGF